MHDQDAPDRLRADLRTAWHRFVDLLAPLRPTLHGYCRRLCGNVWDAEDLVQDTLLRAFGQWGVSYGEVHNPRAYLLRTATNVWIDTIRRRETESRAPIAERGVAPSQPPAPDAASEVRSAGSRLLQRLAPQERAAVVLKEVFDMTLEEISDLLATTPGAVKAALHRGRGRLREPEGEAASRRAAPSRALLDRFVALYDARDLKGLVALMLDGASAENAGNSFHIGPEPEGFSRFLQAVVGGHAEWPEALRPESTRMACVEFEGEPILVGFWKPRGRDEGLTLVFRVEEEDGRIARIRSYSFCPETVREIGAALGVPVLTGLYRAPTPAPGVDWPDSAPLPSLD